MCVIVQDMHVFIVTHRPHWCASLPLPRFLLPPVLRAHCRGSHCGGQHAAGQGHRLTAAGVTGQFSKHKEMKDVSRHFVSQFSLKHKTVAQIPKVNSLFGEAEEEWSLIKKKYIYESKIKFK